MLRRVVYFELALLLAFCLCCSDPAPPPEPDGKEITAFAIASPPAQGVIDQGSGTIDVALPEGTLPLALVATFETTGEEVELDGVVQESGVTANYFIPSRTYTVTAEDGSSRDYVVTMSLPSSGPVEGIDVSQYQGTIDWTAVRNAGKNFVYIRASDGVATDTRFAEYWAAAKAAGLYRGAYHYARFDRDVMDCADHFIDLVSADFQPGDLPPLLDIEATSETPTAAGRLAWAEAWLDTVEQSLGVRPVIYTSTNFWTNDMDGSDRFIDHPLCIAHWTTAQVPAYPLIWGSWAFWQYSGNDLIAGISGSVDLIRFNGGIFPMLVLGKVGE